MADLTGKQKESYVREMFTRVAGHYNRANHWMTWGQDVNWQREVIDRAQLAAHNRVLDIGTGTGNLALEAIRRDRTLQVVAADITPNMMQSGRGREGADQIRWVINDALELPYRSGSFEAVISGYLLRNVSDVRRALLEQYRVLSSGGRMVCLETTQPPGDIWHLTVRLYMRYMLPFLGGLVSGEWAANRYLPESTERFLRAAELADAVGGAGFKEAGYRCFMGGSMAIHWGTK